MKIAIANAIRIAPKACGAWLPVSATKSAKGIIFSLGHLFNLYCTMPWQVGGLRLRISP